MEQIIIALVALALGYGIGRCAGADRRESLRAEVHRRDCIIADWELAAESPSNPIVVRHNADLRRYEIHRGTVDRYFIVAAFPYATDSARNEAHALAMELYETMLRYREYAEPC